MGVIFDTSVLIAAERGNLAIGDLIASAGGNAIAIAAITASELLHGVERADPASLKERRRRFIEWVLENFAVLDFGIREARIHARIWAGLSATGQNIGPHDLIIAATALHLGFSVATLNEREFRRVPGLSLFPV